MELIFPAMVKLVKTCNIIKGIWGHFTAQRHVEPAPGLAQTRDSANL